ncbi:origin recognition complex subunit 3 [Galleria mellonella]|uniref:Origin recognition complex subunit 3 n=1 Tax=Galleria mellonella TaxID=7137 RepID=A0A6J1WCM9_GALME|nr:origin recognition complex subunit 3 [Galleria mellonella]XP_026751188.2 origin recognition complex subunit 3 [Galleria mellonella]XP_031769544.2 origin recognition complex subunit 3 [Galleria mellonella]XP_052753242.1 origin recognition complex subunit 3 [Galleria mellonella]
MESTVSVSKGVFLFSKGLNKKHSQKKSNPNLFDNIFKKEPWYVTYKRNWKYIENKLTELHCKTYSMLLNDMVNYINSFYFNNETDECGSIIPSATLLTGVNQPDHVSQFTALISKIRQEVTSHIAMVNSQDAPTLKHLVENTVWQLIHGYEALDDIESKDSQDNNEIKKIKKSQCTLKVLLKWYNSKYITVSPKKKKCIRMKRSLVIIIPDFESFNCNVLQDFVMIISSYVPALPIVFVFGVATAVSALHKSLPYHVSSKLLIKVFHSHSSPVYMNQVLEDIFLTHTSPFHLSGKAFELLTDVFLFYDFSVTGLVQSIKYCMMDHYYGDNMKALCCERENIEETVRNLSTDDLESIRQLLSFRPFLEAQLDCQTRINLFEDDDFFREVLCTEINKLHDYMYTFYVCVRLLSVLVTDLPKNVLGKSVREIYTKCAVECVTGTQGFKECMQLLNFQSQMKLVENIKQALKIINAALQVVSPVKPLRSTPTKNNLNNIQLSNDIGEKFVKTIRVHLLMFSRQIENANTETCILTDNIEKGDDNSENIPGNRYKLKEKLLKATRVDKIQSEFEMVRSRFVSYLEEMFNKGLQPPHTQIFHEIFFFSDVASVKKHIVGSPRGALHTALSNPIHYLQCSCCLLASSESVVDTLPDVCLAYKLHRECGKHINLFDWLQAFAAVLRPEDDDDQRQQDTNIHIRFTRAVAELQFLGFIKSSKRKTDHVMRLTW